MISLAKYGHRYPGERVRVVGILPEPAIADLLLPPTCLHRSLRRILRIHSKTSKKNHGVSENLYIISLWTVIYHTFTPRPKAKAKIKTKTKKTTNSKSKSKSHWEGWPEHKHLAPKTKRETETLRIIFWTKKKCCSLQDKHDWSLTRILFATKHQHWLPDSYFSNDSSL